MGIRERPGLRASGSGHLEAVALSGFWVIGLFVGIEMFLSGLSWLMLGLALRPASKQALST